MNFLAHLVLSPKETDFILGNLAADFLSGTEKKRLSESIRNGISMHQFVDRFTDTHIQVKVSRNRLTKHFRLLSGVLTDVFYDHFLAKDFEQIANLSLTEFCEYIYETLENNIAVLPARLQRFVPIMIRDNILYSSRELKGIQTALARINHRIKKKFSIELAMASFRECYGLIENDFRIFFPDLIDVTAVYRKNHNTFLP